MIGRHRRCNMRSRSLSLARVDGGSGRDVQVSLSWGSYCAAHLLVRRWWCSNCSWATHFRVEECWVLLVVRRLSVPCNRACLPTAALVSLIWRRRRHLVRHWCSSRATNSASLKLITHVLALIKHIVLRWRIERCWTALKWHAGCVNNSSINSLIARLLNYLICLSRTSMGSRRYWQAHLCSWDVSLLLLSTVRGRWSWNHLWRLRLWHMCSSCSITVCSLTTLGACRGIHVLSANVLVVHWDIVNHLLHSLWVVTWHSCSHRGACCPNSAKARGILFSLLAETNRLEILVRSIKRRRIVIIWDWLSLGRRTLSDVCRGRCVLLLLLLVILLLSASIRHSLRTTSAVRYHRALSLILSFIALGITVSKTSHARILILRTFVYSTVCISIPPIILAIVCATAWLLVLLSIPSSVSSGSCLAAWTSFTCDSRTTWWEALLWLLIVFLLVQCAPHRSSSRGHSLCSWRASSVLLVLWLAMLLHLVGHIAMTMSVPPYGSASSLANVSLMIVAHNLAGLWWDSSRTYVLYSTSTTPFDGLSFSTWASSWNSRDHVFIAWVLAFFILRILRVMRVFLWVMWLFINVISRHVFVIRVMGIFLLCYLIIVHNVSRLLLESTL